METTTYYARVLKGDWKLALDILADIFTESTLDAGEMERERDVILQEIAASHDQPDDLVFDLAELRVHLERLFDRLGLRQELADARRRRLQVGQARLQIDVLVAHVLARRRVAQHIDRQRTQPALRALELLARRDEVDEDRIAITGGSQGGGITLAVAADLHVKAALAMAASYDILPIGAPLPPEDVAAWGAARVAQAFALGFSLAAPFVIAAFVYLRIAARMYMADPPATAAVGAGEMSEAAEPGAPGAPRIAVPAGATIALTACVIVTIGAGLWPGSIADLARDAVPVLTTFG